MIYTLKKYGLEAVIEAFQGGFPIFKSIQRLKL